MPYDREDLMLLQSISGRSWQKKRRMNTVPLDLTTCHTLRELFGDRLQIEPDLRAWATEAGRLQRNLGKIAGASTAELKLLPELNPKLYEAIHLGPKGKRMTAEERERWLAEDACFQAADVQFMAESQGPLNANQPGMGKTFETIAAVYESGKAYEGPHLVLAPVAALETVWGDILRDWQDLPVFVASGDTREDRFSELDDAAEYLKYGAPCWVVANPHQVYTITRTTNGVTTTTEPHPIFHNTQWETEILDEVHMMGFGKPKNQSFKAIKAIKANKKMGLTGTPMGGKVINLFNILQYLRPEIFTSKWQWGGQWLHILENEYGKKFCDGQEGECPYCNGGILKEREERFYQSLIPYILRRTKAEEMKWLPVKQYIDLWAEMTPGQRKVYEQFEKENFTLLDEGDEWSSVSAGGVLDTYTRLRQFAIAKCKRSGKGLEYTEDSGKLIVLQGILDERGIPEGFGTEQVIIFSQFEPVIAMLHKWLARQGIAALRLTGAENRSERDRNVREFQSGKGAKVMLMTTKAGGTAITLDKANAVVFMDQTWNPDNEEQAEDRAHRGDKTDQVMIYYIRTRDTVEEDVFDRVTGKQITNVTVLDKRRLDRLENAS